MRGVLFAMSAVLFVASAPVAGWTAGDDERTWYLGGDERDPYLVFGNQDLGEIALLLVCNN